MYRPVNKFFKPNKPLARINEQIKAPEVRLIDQNGEHIGVLPVSEALKMARERELDLVEINAGTQPPIAKIIDYDKYRYQVEKEEQRKKKQAKTIEVKGIRLSVRISQHDLETKARQADKFLSGGNKVKIEMRLKGRERANIDFAFEQLQKFLQAVSQPHNREQEPKKLGGTITAVLAPAK